MILEPKKIKSVTVSIFSSSICHEVIGEDQEEEKGMTEDEMVGWHHQLDGHEFEQTSGDSEGQGSLACCSSWGLKELDTTERLN